MTLARQMYPENAQKFMQIFNQATQKPFGCLVVDLKPTTHDLIYWKILVNYKYMAMNKPFLIICHFTSKQNTL